MSALTLTSASASAQASPYVAPVAAQALLASLNRIVCMNEEKRAPNCRRGFTMSNNIRKELQKLPTTQQLEWIIQFAPDDVIICICMVVGDCQFPDTCKACNKFLANAHKYGIPPFPAIWVEGAVFYKTHDAASRNVFRVEEKQVLMQDGRTGMLECVKTFQPVFEGNDKKKFNNGEFCAYDNCRFNHPPGWDAKTARSKRACPFGRTCRKRDCEYAHACSVSAE